MTWFVGRGNSLTTGAAYGLLALTVRRQCGLSGSESLEEQQAALRARIAPKIAPIERERVVRFIGELCSIPFSDQDVPMLHAARQDPMLMKEQLRRSFRDWYTTELADGPIGVILDDVQWSDALTLAMFDELLHELHNSSLFVLALGRPELREQFPKLWQNHNLVEITLKGLSKKACERLIQQALGLQISAQIVNQLVEQSLGNALFLEELIPIFEKVQELRAVSQIGIHADHGATRQLRRAPTLRKWCTGGVRFMPEFSRKPAC